jgi:hypothetical protein
MKVRLTKTDCTRVTEYFGVVEFQAPRSLLSRGAAVGEFAMKPLPPSHCSFQLAVGSTEPNLERNLFLSDTWGFFKLVLHAFVAEVRRDLCLRSLWNSRSTISFFIDFSGWEPRRRSFGRLPELQSRAEHQQMADPT